jgi:hypothetical protein
VKGSFVNRRDVLIVASSAFALGTICPAFATSADRPKELRIGYSRAIYGENIEVARVDHGTAPVQNPYFDLRNSQ